MVRKPQRAIGVEVRVLVALMGLPGAGKSTVAAGLRKLGLEVVDRDRLRVERFPALGYTLGDKALLNRAVCTAVADSLRRHSVVVDGMTLSRREEVEALREVAASAGAVFVPLLLQCPLEVAERRVGADQAAGVHPAADRSVELVRAVHARFEPPPPDAVILDATLGRERMCAQARAVVVARASRP